MEFRLFDGGTKEQRAELEDTLRDLSTEVERALPGREWHDDGTPSWWVDDEEAAASTLAAGRGPRPR